MRSWFFVFGVLTLFSYPAAADVVYLDLFSGGQPGTAGSNVGNICGKTVCLNPTKFSPVQELPAGSTVDFGTVTFFPTSLLQLNGDWTFFTGAVEISFEQFNKGSAAAAAAVVRFTISS